MAGQASAAGRKAGLGSRIRREGREWAQSIAVAFALFLFIRAFLVQAFKIPTASMENTLLVGDFLLVNKVIYGPKIPFTPWRLPAIREPRRGDIVVFEYPKDRDLDFVKRCMAVPGDTVMMRNKVLYIGGHPLDEPYVQHIDPRTIGGWPRPVANSLRPPSFPLPRDNFGPFVVPDGSLFVMGDNRDNSSDSRVWGFVDRGLVKGTPLFIYFSWNGERLLPRLKRVGKIIR